MPKLQVRPPCAILPNSMMLPHQSLRRCRLTPRQCQRCYQIGGTACQSGVAEMDTWRAQRFHERRRERRVRHRRGQVVFEVWSKVCLSSTL